MAQLLEMPCLRFLSEVFPHFLASLCLRGVAPRPELRMHDKFWDVRELQAALIFVSV